MTNECTPIKLVVSLVVVAALVATRFSSSINTSSESSTMTSRNLKGSRNLQFAIPLSSRSPFTGGVASGTSSGGGSAVGSGMATVLANMAVAIADGTGSGQFTSTSGSSGFVDTMFGSADGSSAAGATGSQAGNVGIVNGGLGTLTFEGTTTSSGNGGFGAGVSPVQFNTVVTEVPGSPLPATFGSPKKGGTTSGGFSPSTFITTVVPVSTGPTGGFGTGSGALNIASTTGGTLMEMVAGPHSTGVGTSGGTATNFGGGSGSGTNSFGSAGGLGSGASTGAAAATGKAADDTTNGVFLGTGGATANFNNQGFGVFGTPRTLPFP